MGAKVMSPKGLLTLVLKELGGFGIFHTHPAIPKGGVLFANVPQTFGKLKFLVQLTPVEWLGDGDLPIPPINPQTCTLKVENGWLKIVVPFWGTVMVLPGDSEYQRVMQEPRSELIFGLRLSMSRTTRHILLSFQQE